MFNLPPVGEKYSIYIWPAIGLVFSILVGAFIIVPRVFEIIKTNATLYEKEKLTVNLEKKVDILEGIDLEKYKSDYKYLAVILPAQPDVPSAVSQLQKLAADSSIKISAFSIALPAAESSAESFQIRVEIEGGVENISKFAADIKKASRLMTLDRIEVAGKRSALTYTAAVNLKAYFQKQQTLLSPIDQLISSLTAKELEAVSVVSQNVARNIGVSEVTTTGPKGKPNPFE